MNNQTPRIRTHRPEDRRGTIAVLGAVLSIIMIGMVAFSVDIGYMFSVKEELQRTADSAALAAAWKYGNGLADDLSSSACQSNGRIAAADAAAANEIGNMSPLLDTNASNSACGDMVFGTIGDFDASTQLDSSDPDTFNAVTVKVRRDSNLNGEAPLFFAKVFGVSSAAMEASATAALIRNVGGFEAPSSGANIDLLPFALDRVTHEAWLAKDECVVTDDWTYDEQTGQVTCGPDGWYEVNLYPQGTGSPGNRGTVDIGGANNSTNDIARQIMHGVNACDLDDLGKPLVFDGCGKLTLNGDTGISAGVKDELADIIGEPRCIPIFSEVNGPGNNAIYTIVAWQGVRIMDVKLTGPMKKKHVTIQRAPLICDGAVQAESAGKSDQVYSRVVLVD